MKVERLTLREIQMPLLHPFKTSFDVIQHRRIVLVELDCEGVSGWGEATVGEDPYYNEESTETGWHIISQYLAPALLGKQIASAREVPALFAKVRQHRMAKAAVENAVWEAESIQRGVPLWKLIGGTRRQLECGVSIGIQPTPEQLMQKIETELAAGYRRIKVKIMPGWDVDIIGQIRQRWPKILLSCDANSAYELSDIEHLKRLDDFGLLMIEQPLWSDDLYFHAQMQKQMKTALCLDESIRTARDAQTAIELGSCRIVNIKLGRVGGFSEAIEVHDTCKERGVPVWCGGMLESGVGRAHNVALSTLESFSLPGDISASKRYWKEDIIEPEVTVSGEGLIDVKDTPGTGFKVKKDLIERLTVRKESFS